MTKIPVIDLSAYQSTTLPPDTSARHHAASALVQACHTLGFCAITGHGIPASKIHDAFSRQKCLFNLPLSDKMKAPHPAAAIPHRGYSGVGVEKVYSRDDAVSADADGSGDGATGANGTGKAKGAEAVREISDYKESYEIGSEENPEQGNIWLPEETLPGFREWGVGLYWEMNRAANRILDALADGLLAVEGGYDRQGNAASSQQQREQLVQMNGQQCNQLRLLHYPALDSGRLRRRLVARMPAHTDWGTFTLLFQDGDVGGLELQDPASGEWVAAEPAALPEDAMLLNVADFFERVTNGYLKSANHRVTLPRSATGDDSEQLLERYSMPYFVAPLSEFRGSCLPTFVSEKTPAKYDPMTFGEYGAWRAKYSY